MQSELACVTGQKRTLFDALILKETRRNTKYPTIWFIADFTYEEVVLKKLKNSASLQSNLVPLPKATACGFGF